MEDHKESTPKEVISYAQNWEDLILHVLLHKVKKGFYVDVGANGPVVDSVTNYFYERGWNGINIEPSPAHIKALKKHRPRDINLQLAVGNTKGGGEFREYLGGHHGLSTLSPDLKKEIASHEDFAYHEYSVDILPLKAIFKKELKPNQAIDFLKIDVEGLEYEVIEGNDWSKYRPKIVAIESTHVKKDWRPLLKEAGYREVYFDGLNEYYASREYTPQVDLSIYPKIVTERGPVISWQQYLRREELIKETAITTTNKVTRQFEPRIQKAESNLHTMEFKAAHRLQVLQWVYARPFRFALGRFYHYYIKRDQKKEYKE